MELPPLDTSGLTETERITLRVAHTLVRNDALDCLGISAVAYNARLNAVWQKFRDQQREAMLQQEIGGAGSPSMGGYLNRGYRRNWGGVGC